MPAGETCPLLKCRLLNPEDSIGEEGAAPQTGALWLSKAARKREWLENEQNGPLQCGLQIKGRQWPGAEFLDAGRGQHGSGTGHSPSTRLAAPWGHHLETS